MQKIIDLSHSSQVRESLRAELMAKYDGKKNPCWPRTSWTWCRQQEM